ncbi:hypothetical protein ACM66B_000853 [Microbotryomycetes sp. NB124-2]
MSSHSQVAQSQRVNLSVKLERLHDQPWTAVQSESSMWWQLLVAVSSSCGNTVASGMLEQTVTGLRASNLPTSLSQQRHGPLDAQGRGYQPTDFIHTYIAYSNWTRQNGLVTFPVLALAVAFFLQEKVAPQQRLICINVLEYYRRATSPAFTGSEELARLLAIQHLGSNEMLSLVKLAQTPLQMCKYLMDVAHESGPLSLDDGLPIRSMYMPNELQNSVSPAAGPSRFTELPPHLVRQPPPSSQQLGHGRQQPLPLQQQSRAPRPAQQQYYVIPDPSRPSQEQTHSTYQQSQASTQQKRPPQSQFRAPPNNPHQPLVPPTLPASTYRAQSATESAPKAVHPQVSIPTFAQAPDQHRSSVAALRRPMRVSISRPPVEYGGAPAEVLLERDAFAEALSNVESALRRFAVDKSKVREQVQDRITAVSVATSARSDIPTRACPMAPSLMYSMRFIWQPPKEVLADEPFEAIASPHTIVVPQQLSKDLLVKNPRLVDLPHEVRKAAVAAFHANVAGSQWLSVLSDLYTPSSSSDLGTAKPAMAKLPRHLHSAWKTEADRWLAAQTMSSTRSTASADAPRPAFVTSAPSSVLTNSASATPSTREAPVSALGLAIVGVEQPSSQAATTTKSVTSVSIEQTNAASTSNSPSLTVHPLATVYANASTQQRQKAREQAKRLSPKMRPSSLPGPLPPPFRRPDAFGRKPSVSSPLASYAPLASPTLPVPDLNPAVATSTATATVAAVSTTQSTVAPVVLDKAVAPTTASTASPVQLMPTIAAVSGYVEPEEEIDELESDDSTDNMLVKPRQKLAASLQRGDAEREQAASATAALDESRKKAEKEQRKAEKKAKRKAAREQLKVAAAKKKKRKVAEIVAEANEAARKRLSEGLNRVKGSPELVAPPVKSVATAPSTQTAIPHLTLRQGSPSVDVVSKAVVAVSDAPASLSLPVAVASTGKMSRRVRISRQFRRLNAPVSPFG